MGKIIQGHFNNHSEYKRNCTVILAAAGCGSRMALGFNKIFLSIDEKPVIAYSLEMFETVDDIKNVIIVAAKDDIPLINDIVREFKFRKVKNVICGGSTRQESILNGLVAVPADTDIVLTHDAARPLVTERMILELIKAADKYEAATLGVYAIDTLKTVDDELFVTGTLNRSKIVNIQTPQAFKKDIIIKAHKEAIAAGFKGTDDCSLVEKIGVNVKVVLGERCNIKLTSPEDFVVISAFMEYRE
ncbi:MAG: 2-C-methyl-D-erythritol 4-phosphate cytidylyltransferase [Clostridia bacterium]|nr:2-C-methyl-D-erythritol 4-phosphate cytidylyltransferase [Clostridia bacterium]